MAVQIQGISFNHILTFPIRDAESRKRFLVAAAFSLGGMIIPFLPGLFVGGYSIRLLRRIIQDGEVSMPEWNDWNRLLIDGVYSFLISLVYILPGLLTLAAGFAAYIISFLLVIPTTDQPDAGSVFLIFLPMAILSLGIAVGLLLLILGVIPLPVALSRFADEGRFSAAFQPHEIWRSLKSNPVGYAGAWVVLLGLIYLFYTIYMISYATVILCCLGYALLLIGGLEAGMVWNAMIGLAYRQSKETAADT